MKFFMVSLLFALLAACALAVDAPKKSVLISSESEDVIKQAIDEVKAAVRPSFLTPYLQTNK